MARGYFSTIAARARGGAPHLSPADPAPLDAPAAAPVGRVEGVARNAPGASRPERARLPLAAPPALESAPPRPADAPRKLLEETRSTPTVAGPVEDALPVAALVAPQLDPPFPPARPAREAPQVLSPAAPSPARTGPRANERSPVTTVAGALHAAFQWVTPTAPSPADPKLLEAGDARVASASPERHASESGDRIEIGVIDVHVHPPAPPAPKPRAPPSGERLARPFQSGLGLRQS